MRCLLLTTLHMVMFGLIPATGYSADSDQTRSAVEGSVSYVEQLADKVVQEGDKAVALCKKLTTVLKNGKKKKAEINEFASQVNATHAMLSSFYDKGWITIKRSENAEQLMTKINSQASIAEEQSGLVSDYASQMCEIARLLQQGGSTISISEVNKLVSWHNTAVQNATAALEAMKGALDQSEKIAKDVEEYLAGVEQTKALIKKAQGLKLPIEIYIQTLKNYFEGAAESMGSVYENADAVQASTNRTMDWIERNKDLKDNRQKLEARLKMAVKRVQDVVKYQGKCLDPIEPQYHSITGTFFKKSQELDSVIDSLNRLIIASNKTLQAQTILDSIIESKENILTIYDDYMAQLSQDSQRVSDCHATIINIIESQSIPSYQPPTQGYYPEEDDGPQGPSLLDIWRNR